MNEERGRVQDVDSFGLGIVEQRLRPHIPADDVVSLQWSIGVHSNSQVDFRSFAFWLLILFG